MRFIRHLLTVGILFVSSSFPIHGQDDDQIRIETNLVTIGVVAKDKKGNYISGLEKGQFTVYDNKVKQNLSIFSAEDSPISFGIVYDLHPTTTERTRIVLDALKRFTSDLRQKDDFFVIVFNEHGSLDLDFVPPIDQVERHLSSGKAGGPDSLYDAVFLASEKLRKKKNARRSLIIISDGADHYSHHNFSSLSKSLKSVNVQIYTLILTRWKWWDYSDITIGTRIRRWPWDERELERAALRDVAEKSGGRTETPYAQSTSELYNIFKEAGQDMRKQYILGFYPEMLDGKWHKIEVKTDALSKDGKKLRLSHREGYQSLKKS